MPVYRFEKLDAKHDKASFQSDSEILNRWFREQAGQQVRSRTAVVYVLIHIPSNIIAGFYTLSTASIASAEFSDDWVRTLKLPRYNTLPVLLLRRLAVDKKFVKQGLGRLLVVDAVRIAEKTILEVGAIGLVVDAKDDKAVAFYKRLGFWQFPGNKSKLLMPAKDFSAFFAAG